MYQANGFTLIELITVIVVLGILSAFALPRFANLGTQAQTAKAQGAESAYKGASAIAQSMAMLNNTTSSSDTTIPFEGQTIIVNPGFAKAAWNSTFRQLLDIDTNISFTSPGASYNGFKYCGVGMRPTGSIATELGLNNGFISFIWPEGCRIADQCYAYYHNPENGSYPNIGSNTSGC